MFKCVRVPIAMIVASLASQCSVLPDMPPNFELPINEILLNAACELRTAFKTMDADELRRFRGPNWLIAVVLTPKVDTDFNAGVGWTRKSPTNVANPVRLTNWVIGSAPGIQLDAKGNRTGGITYNIKASELIADNTLPCDSDRPSFHALSQHLGIGEWLHRTVKAASGAGNLAQVDKPSYSSDITIKFSGSGSYTYTFPPGSDLGTLGGYYSVDEMLQINMTYVSPPQSYKVQSLPTGGNFGTPKAARVPTAAAVSMEDAKARLDLIQLQQAIMSLPRGP